MKLSKVIYGLILFCVGCTSFPATEAGFHEYLDGMYGTEVPLLKAHLLDDSLSLNYLVLDTRAKEEFEVSHLPNARWIGFSNFQQEKLENIPKDQPILVYCSVGYRSERIGKKLQKMGFQEVYNLYGGIFEWKNKGRIIYNSQESPTDSIHTYNRKWGKWAFNGIKVY